MTDNEYEAESKKHADVIRAWLDGSIIQFKVKGKVDGGYMTRWIDYRWPDIAVISPITHYPTDWRIKPED